MPGRITLHEEIVAILSESADEWMTTAEIAALVTSRGRYHKGDRSPMTAFQIHGRTRNYSKLFERDGSRVRLRRGAGDNPTPARPLRIQEPRRIPANGDLVGQALAALSQPGESAIAAAASAPRRPGLYAITATATPRKELGFDPDVGILYVGKAEHSLEGRDLRQHFADGQTGRSTLRRSLAALLVEELELIPMPRNPRKPADFDRYGLEPDSDARLTEWMRSELRLSFWAAPLSTLLRPVEIAAIQHFAPPLNLTDVVTQFTADIKTRRKFMADRARAWVGRAL